MMEYHMLTSEHDPGVPTPQSQAVHANVTTHSAMTEGGLLSGSWRWVFCRGRPDTEVSGHLL